MSSGTFNLEVPHFCGELIEVTVKWWYSGGTYENPPDGDEEWDYPDNCDKCGIILVHDGLFQNNIEQAIKRDPNIYTDSEYLDDDDVDYEPMEDPLNG